VGNLAQEMGDLDETFRLRLNQVFEALRERIAAALQQAGQQLELPAGVEAADLAGFILNSWQGAILQMKVAKSIAPLESFERIIFDSLLDA
jgi:TetR/AcrR family transcriptional repressor of nem operon